MTSGGSLQTRQTYFPYGVKRVADGNPLPMGMDTTFTGQKSDDSTGLRFYGARYYDTSLGRFTQADTIVPNAMDPQSLNRYSYVRNNPVKYVDPTGHEAEPACQSWDTWCWENRYWTAQGKCYNEGSGEWTRECAPTIGDPDMLAQVAAENPNILARPDTQLAQDVVDYILEKMRRDVTSAVAALTSAYLHCPDLSSGCLAAKADAYAAWGWVNLPADWCDTNDLGAGCGMWDFKPEIRRRFNEWQHVGAFNFHFDVWTNIHFGYVGAAIGFSLDHLLDGAGVAQKIGNAEVSWGFPLRSMDDPYDLAAIGLGYQLWADYGLTVQKSDIVSAVQVYPGLNHQ